LVGFPTFIMLNKKVKGGLELVLRKSCRSRRFRKVVPGCLRTGR
jgi:hypothetical protein